MDNNQRDRTFWKWLPLYSILAAAFTSTLAMLVGTFLARTLHISRTYTVVVISIAGVVLFAWYGEKVITSIAKRRSKNHD